MARFTRRDLVTLVCAASLTVLVAPMAHGVPAVAGSVRWASVDAGESHTCGIRTSGFLWCWGSNAAGQLGDGSTTARLAPERIGHARDWAGVSTGRAHTCGIRTAGTLWCWGSNTYGQLGDGTRRAHLRPKQI